MKLEADTVRRIEKSRPTRCRTQYDRIWLMCTLMNFLFALSRTRKIHFFQVFLGHWADRTNLPLSLTFPIASIRTRPHACPVRGLWLDS
jgi:hypothetical protein